MLVYQWVPRQSEGFDRWKNEGVTIRNVELRHLGKNDRLNNRFWEVKVATAKHLEHPTISHPAFRILRASTFEGAMLSPPRMSCKDLVLDPLTLDPWAKHRPQFWVAAQHSTLAWNKAFPPYSPSEKDCSQEVVNDPHPIYNSLPTCSDHSSPPALRSCLAAREDSPFSVLRSNGLQQFVCTVPMFSFW